MRHHSGRPASKLESFISDRNLLPRIEQYAYNNDAYNIPFTVEYLRHNYSEYRRKQLGPFTRLVGRAVSILRHRLQDGEEEESEIEGSTGPPSGRRRKRNHGDPLALIEEEHLLRRRETANGSTCEPESRSDLGSASSSEDDVVEIIQGIEKKNDNLNLKGQKLKQKVIQRRHLEESLAKRNDCSTSKRLSSDSEQEDGIPETYNLLNSSLRATYNGRPALILESPSNIRPLQLKENSITPLAKGSSVVAFTELELAEHGAQSYPTPLRKQNEGTQESGDKSVKRFADQPVVERLMQIDHTMKHTVEEHEQVKHFSQQGLPDKRARDQGEVDMENEKSQVVRKIRKVNTRKKKIISAEVRAVSRTAIPERVTFDDLGGIEATIDAVSELIYPLKCPQVYHHLGVSPPVGLLLQGPPGCGKTKLANAIAYEANLPLLKISAPEVVSGLSGESEAKLRSLFAEASELAPCIIFIDEIDAIMSKRESAHREMERRIVTQLMTCMDELHKPVVVGSEDEATSSSGGYVLVIGATNRPEALDPALRRPGRFDREIVLDIPDENARVKIMSVLIKDMRLEGSFDLTQIARKTPGFVGADLVALTREAASAAIKRIIVSRKSETKADRLMANSPLKDGSPEDVSVTTLSHHKNHYWRSESWTHEELMSLSINMQDFEEAINKVQPSTKREGFTSIPNVSWEDVGSLDDVRKKLELFISMRIKEPEIYDELHMDMGTGFLLYGPPGCGKTLVAKAVANSAGANFIYVKGPELLSKYVGESERAVRQLFSRARSCVPCIIFFDEIDALAPRRGNDGNAAAERVVNQLLIEMDGLEQRKGIFSIAATNRLDMIDPALRRPGRLDKLIYIPLPDMQGRASILKAITRSKPLAQDVNLTCIAESKLCDGFSGADIAALVNEACMVYVEEYQYNNTIPALISQRHFEAALTRVTRSVSINDERHYRGSNFHQLLTVAGTSEVPL